MVIDIVNPGFETGDTSGWENIGATTAIVLSPVHGGTYACKISSYANVEIFQTVSEVRGIDAWKGTSISVSCWCYSSYANNNALELYILGSGGGQWLDFHSGASGWEQLTVSGKVVPETATSFRVGLFNTGNYHYGYFDDVSIVAPPPQSIVRMIFHSRTDGLSMIFHDSASPMIFSEAG